MKRVLSLISVLVLLLGLTACQNAESEAVIGGSDGPTSVIVAEEKETEEKTEVEKQTEEKEEEQEFTEDGRPVVYWANPSLRDSSDVAYHKKDCKIIKDLKPDKLPWALIEALNMEPCEKCNPDK